MSEAAHPEWKRQHTLKSFANVPHREASVLAYALQTASEEELEILRQIEENPNLTQRQIADHLGLSLGKINYLIKALLEKGVVKVDNFKRSDNKLGYLYLLTPEGVERKRKLTLLFIQRKSEEFDKLKAELSRTEKQ